MTYTNPQLHSFSQELEPYRKTTSIGSYIDTDKYLIAQGALVVRGDYAPAIKNLPLYLELEDKLEQWRKYRGKVEYAKQKEVEARVETAEMAF